MRSPNAKTVGAAKLMPVRHALAVQTGIIAGSIVGGLAVAPDDIHWAVCMGAHPASSPFLRARDGRDRKNMDSRRPKEGPPGSLRQANPTPAPHVIARGLAELHT